MHVVWYILKKKNTVPRHPTLVFNGSALASIESRRILRASRRSGGVRRATGNWFAVRLRELTTGGSGESCLRGAESPGVSGKSAYRERASRKSASLAARSTRSAASCEETARSSSHAGTKNYYIFAVWCASDEAALLLVMLYPKVDSRRQEGSRLGRRRITEIWRFSKRILEERIKILPNANCLAYYVKSRFLTLNFLIF